MTKANTLHIQLAGACALLLLALSLGGCFPRLDPGPAPAHMRLNPAMPGHIDGKRVKQQITVALPQLAEDIDNDRIAVVVQGREIRHFSGARWSSGLGGVMNDSFARALESTGAFEGVGGEMDGLAARYRLNSDVSLFALEYQSETSLPEARFSASFRLMDAHEAQVIAAKQIELSVPATGSDAASLVAALEKALEQGLAEMCRWVVLNVK